MVFDPKRKKEIFHEFKLNYMKNEIEEFDPKKPMGNMALHLLDDIISGFLVQLKAEVEVYLPTVHEWLDFSISQIDSRNQVDENQFYRAQMFKGKALTCWMSNNINEKNYWEKARLIWSDFDNSNRNIYAKSKFKTEFLDDYIQLCLQSEAYQEGINRFEKYYGKKEISINKKMTAREYGYLLCLNYLEPKYRNDKLVQLGQKMLTQYMREPWLRMGLYSYSAIWLKIIYWDKKITLNQFDTIMKAYESLPNIEFLK